MSFLFYFFFFSSRRRHTRSKRDWSSDVCSSDLSSILVLDGGAETTRTVIGSMTLELAVRPDQRAILLGRQIGRASCRERGKVAQAAVSLKGKSYSCAGGKHERFLAKADLSINGS